MGVADAGSDGGDTGGDAERRLFQALPDGAVIYDVLFDEVGAPVDYLVRDVNAAYEVMSGAPRATWIGARLSAVEMPSGRPGQFAAVVMTGEAAQYEVHDRGRDRHFQVSAFLLDKGRLTTVVRDVTPQRRTEVELRETEGLFRTTVGNLPINLVLYDRDYQILYMNPALAATCSAICGRPESELVGLRGAELWPEAIWKPLHAHTERAIETRERQSYDLETTLPGRGRVIRQWTIVPLQGPDGKVQRLLTISLDVTVQRQLVEELRQADRRKSEFIAVLSHELRNPLAAIQASLYVLQNGPLDSEAVTSSRRVIDRQVDQLVRMLDDLLDVTRLSHSKVQLQRRRLDVNDLVRATVEDSRSHLEQNGVRVELGLATTPVHINADGVRIGQVLSNLLSNAVKFTPPGGKARVSVSAEGDAHAVLRVEDSGVGIAPALLPKLFEPFMQAERTLDRPGGGLGLGLALVRGLVELHGGQVSVSSPGEGRGAEFVVRLPLDADAVPEQRPGLPSGTLPTGRRVLVIEDDNDVASGLRMALAIDGHEVEVARNGRDGIAKARELLPEVVLCDIGLPGMDGYAVARALRQDRALDGTLLVALSGYTQAADIAKSRAAGFDEHLAKPMSLEKINRVLRRGRPASS